MKSGPAARLIEGGDDSELLRGTRRNDTIYGLGGDDTIIGGRGVDLMFGGEGSDVFLFNDRSSGDVSFGRADAIGDFGPEDIIDISRTEVRFFAGFGVVEPERAGFSIWEASGNVYLTWNTFGEFHDVELTGFDGDIFGLLQQIRWYDDDYLGTVATDASIAPGETVTGTIEVDLDQDWFGIELEEGLLYTFDLQGEADGGGTLENPIAVLYDADGNFVASGFEELLFLAETSGSYFIAAQSFDGTGTYTLEVAAEVYVDDFGDGLDTSRTIAAGETVTGLIGVPNDQDWFRFEAEEDGTLTIDLRGASSGSGTLPDPFLMLLDEEGQELAWNDDTNGFDSQIVFEAEAESTYYIAARELGLGTGTYELALSGSESDPLLF